MAQPPIQVKRLEVPRLTYVVLLSLFFEGFSSLSSSLSSPKSAKGKTRNPRKAPTSRQFISPCSVSRSTRELQIRALERATAMLEARIVETRDRVSQLRDLLADPRISREELDHLKRERWMKEHRLIVDDLESAHARKCLHQIRESDVPLIPPATQPSSSSVKLNTFLDTQQTTKVPLPTSTRRLYGPRLINDPMFRHSLQPPNAQHSVAREDTYIPSYLLPLLIYKPTYQVRPLLLRRDVSLTFKISSTRALVSTEGEAHDTKVSCSSESSCSVMTPTSTPPIRLRTLSGAEVPTSAALPKQPSSAFGEAYIHEAEPPRPISDILANLGDIPLPDYALNLIGSFGTVASGKFELTPLSHEEQRRPKHSMQSRQERGVKTRSLQAQDVTPRTPKRWSIFSLNLQHKETPEPPLPIVSESGPMASPKGMRLRRVQRSTRNRDLALLNPAPDDIQPTQVPPTVTDISLSNHLVTSGRNSIIMRVKRRFAPLRFQQH